jgi:hypothetical protein
MHVIKLSYNYRILHKISGYDIQYEPIWLNDNLKYFFLKK